VTHGVFVTGTDTGVGKTFACRALLHSLAARGIAALPMKPIAAGAVRVDGTWENEDTRALREASGLDTSWRERVTPVLLRAAMAPHIAARYESREITLAPLIAAFRELAATGRYVVVEGVGGFRVPLAANLDTVDLARALALPVVLVVGMRLGCLNHALLTAHSVESAGLRLAGWIANTIDPAMAAPDENLEALRERLAAPLLGRIPWMPEGDALAASRALDVTAIV
jgi:dethiobiotin synthetase